MPHPSPFFLFFGGAGGTRVGNKLDEAHVLHTGRRRLLPSGGGPNAAGKHLALCSTAHRAGSSRRKPWLAAVEYLKLCSHEAQKK